MHAVITVVGSDKVGILARISAICAESGVNIEDVTQTILSGTFAMIMLVSLPEAGVTITGFSEKLRAGGDELGVEVTVTRRDIYDAMHKV